ncbi:MAG: zinc-binding dehydrogenase [Atribacter sp.]|jgi:L-iditol 2-dehydrogenase|uniref:zinc-binding dehydrogenase n=1 Tax=Atribacter sp. TaxID=2847780 RepID=UPI003D994762
MKAAIVNKETGKPEIVDVPIPEIQEGEILFKPMACGVCGSDVIDWNINGPGSFGHEPAGIVVKVGKNVKNVKEGDRIFVHHRVPNPDCRFFRRGHGTVCPEYPQYGFIPSAYAEFTRVTERHVRLDLIHLPDHISFEVGALIEPMATMWRLMSRAGLQGGDTVLVIGAGALGLSAIQVAQRLGATMVINSDYNDWKLEYSKALGVDFTINRGKHTLDEIKEIIRESNEGRLADVVVVIPPRIKALEEGIELTEKGGVVSQFGPTGPGEVLTIDPNYFFFREITYAASYSSTPNETKMVADFIFKGKLKVKHLITHHYTLDQIMEALALKKKAEDSLKIMVHPHPDEYFGSNPKDYGPYSFGD